MRRATFARAPCAWQDLTVSLTACAELTQEGVYKTESMRAAEHSHALPTPLPLSPHSLWRA
jgi:hypothetical protein